MKLKNLFTTTILASTITLTGALSGVAGLANDAHAATFAQDNGKATVQWKDPNTGRMYKEYGANTHAVAKTKVVTKARAVVPKTTYVDKYAGFATFTYKKNGKFVTEVAKSQQKAWKAQQAKGKKVTKGIYYWYKGKRYTYTYTFYKK